MGNPQSKGKQKIQKKKHNQKTELNSKANIDVNLIF